MFFPLSLVLFLIGCGNNSPEPITPTVTEIVSHEPLGTRVPPFTLRGRSYQLTPFPPADPGGRVDSRVNWLIAQNPSPKVDRLVEALQNRDVHVMVNLDPTFAGAFRRSTAKELEAGKPPYALEFGGGLWRTDVIPDLLIMVAQESVLIGQCLDFGRCPGQNTIGPLSPKACQARWELEQLAYSETCVMAVSLGRLPPLNCDDQATLNEFTYQMMDSAGQTKGIPECDPIWKAHLTP